MGFLFLGSLTHNFNRLAVRNSSSTPQETPKSEPTVKAKTDYGIRKVTTLTGLQKWALVFSGKYKTKSEIPEYVPHEVLERARSRARIKLSNILMGLTLVGCLAFAYSGRQAASRGESVHQMNVDWHKEYAEKLQQEQKTKSK